MGQRARRKRARRRPAPPRPAPAASPPPPPGTPYADICRWLGQSGVILVLFETPSGFAVLHYDGVKLFRRNALEDIWSEFIDMPWARMLHLFWDGGSRNHAAASSGASSQEGCGIEAEGTS
ncbi:uncharacterized protein [Triticum aestivum]|uniref:uncharacterized protein isoform X2 n=1 Tax=Triticum aestivum TaxID=4565 RepID=UPI001D01AB97|nr:uncharacterized protein LOC123141706 isoform X2 [Triticum aestivum]